jgi:hypothetical protein
MDTTDTTLDPVMLAAIAAAVAAAFAQRGIDPTASSVTTSSATASLITKEPASTVSQIPKPQLLTNTANAGTPVPMAEAIATGRLLYESEVANIIGKSPRTLEAWRQRGLGPPYIRIGRSRRTRLDALQGWLAAREFATVAGEKAEAPSTFPRAPGRPRGGPGPPSGAV